MNPNLSRRTFSKGVFAAATCMGTQTLKTASRPEDQKIDRRALCTRHSIRRSAPDILCPLSVGNGEFAFTADITGLQTFAEEYRRGIPLATMAQWGFHSSPNPEGFSLEKFPLTYLDAGGQQVGYLYYEDGKSPKDLGPAAGFLYSNPGRLNLGRIGLALEHGDGRRTSLEDLSEVHQELDLWAGCLESSFKFEGQGVEVTTVCHPLHETVAVRVRSPLLANGRLAVFLAFPNTSAQWGGDGADWTHPNSYRTILERTAAERADFTCQLDRTRYHATLQWSQGALHEETAHHYRLRCSSDLGELQLVLGFRRSPSPDELPSFDQTASDAKAMWVDFWSHGAAIDLSQSKDPRWQELERRIVLSRYLTRIQCAGSLPPQETGLTSNSWFGKFHLEMHWWHAAHFALWGQCDLLERSLPFYQRILPKAQKQAQKQGYRGARWPKCVGPEGDPAPTYLECFLIWQQPHPIFYAELCYRAHPGPRTLEKYREIVFETAEFMASYAVWMPLGGQYRIGPPFADAAEIYFEDHEHQSNPTFEVAYWRWGLERAQRWRERLGLGREEHWDHVLTHLPPLAVRSGVYVAGETAADTFESREHTTSHPCLLAPLGMLDGAMVDPKTMRNTLNRVMNEWGWKDTWGWDYPLIAMTAARVGEQDKAIDALLMPEPKNTYLANGHNFQSQNLLPLYLPGNGGLLYAIALMAGGWDDAPKRHAPGFPDNGEWIVRAEGFEVAP